GNVEGAAVHAHARVRGEDRQLPAVERTDWPARVRADYPCARDPERSADVHRRYRWYQRAGDARKGAAIESRARTERSGRRLRPVDDRAGTVREPHARACLDFAIAEGVGEGTECSDHPVVAVVACARGAVRQAANAFRPARV